MRELLKKLLIAPVLLALVVSAVIPSSMIVEAQEPNVEQVVANIYPLPQKEELLSNEGTKLSGNVNLVIHGEHHDITVPAIKKVLDANGITYTESNALDPERSNILVTSNKDEFSLYGEDLKDDETLNESQGYVLKVQDGDITIVGSDKDGVYNAVETLAQIFDQKTEDGTITEVIISDYPDIKLRGYVEGFYGYPWTFEQRASMLEAVGKLKMNTYIYAPKDDPYHLANWREPYPEAEAKQLEELAKIAHDNNIDFVWSVHPGDTYNYNNDNDYNALIAKFETLYDLGIRQFGISYDDLGGAQSGARHAGVINRVDKEWVQMKGDVKPLLTVGTRYAEDWGVNNYIEPFLQAFEDTETIVMWTGKSTMSTVKREYFEWPKVKAGTKRDIALWWNYPVNDYIDGNMMMAPLETMENDVDNLSGLFLNPMSQAEASKVAVYSGADYAWNVGGFDAIPSWKRAIKEITPDVNEAFERFADNMSFLDGIMPFDESRYLIDTIAEVQASLESGVGVAEAIAKAKAVFEQLSDDVVLLKGMDNKVMLADVQQHLVAYELVVEAGLASVSALEGAISGDIKATLDAIDLSQTKLVDADKVTIKSLEGATEKANKVNVFERRVKPFISKLNDSSNTILMDSLFKDPNAFVTVDGQDETPAQITKGALGYEVSGVGEVSTDQHITAVLGELVHIANVELEGETLDSVQLQYSINGIDWTDLDYINGSASSINQTIAYFRVLVLEDAKVDAIRLNLITQVSGGKASTNLGTYSNFRISNIIDGNLNTQYYSDSGTQVGSYVQVEFDEAQSIYDASIHFATNPKGASEGIDGFKATKLQYSNDGVTWKDASASTHMDNYLHSYNGTKPVSSALYSVDGISAKFWRFTATESYGNWVQVYEVEFNKGVGDHIDLVQTEITSGVKKHLYDRDLSTYYEPTVKAGDSLEYSFSTVTDIEQLIIVQDELKLSNAKVEVLTLDGTWRDVGILDQAVNTLQVREQVTKVKLTFTDVQPRIAEIIEVEMKHNTDLSELEAAIDKAEDFILDNDKDLYTTSTWNAFVEAIDFAKTLTPSNTVGEVELAIALLTASQNGLEKRVSPEVIDLLESTVTRLETTEDVYTAEEFAAVKALLENAKLVIDKHDDVTSADVYALIAEIFEAEKPLLDLSDAIVALNALVNHIDVAQAILDGDVSNLRPAKVEALRTAVQTAQTLVDEVSRDVDALNAAADAITDAVSELWEIVDKSGILAAIEATDSLDEKYYTPESWSALQDAIENGRSVADNDDATTTEVKDAEIAILDAIKNLVVALNYQALNREIAAVEAILEDAALYVPSTIKNLNTALEVARKLLDTATTQSEIDEGVEALVKAKLAVRLKADTSKLAGAIDEAKAIDQSKYTKDSVANLNTVLEQVTAILGDIEVTQETVDLAEATLRDAIGALVSSDGPTVPGDGDDKPEQPEKPGDTDKPGLPATGIDSGLPMEFALLVIAGSVLILLDRRKSYRKEH